MSDLACLLGRHDWGAWQLRPPTIGAPVPFLYWQRACRRRASGRPPRPCGATQRRWFRVRQPEGVAISAPMPVDRYLERIRMQAPSPEDPRLIDSPTPPRI